MSRVHDDSESLRGTVDSSSFLSRSTGSSRLSVLFDFDQQLFSSSSYQAMIRKTVKLSIRSPKNGDLGRDKVVTTISSDAVEAALPERPKSTPKEDGVERTDRAERPASSPLTSFRFGRHRLETTKRRPNKILLLGT